MIAEQVTAARSPATTCGPAELHLLAGPYVVLGGRRRELPEGSKRVVVFVALHGGQVDRQAVAGTLWPVGSDARAAGNLRSALWRLRGVGIDVLESTSRWLRLRADTVVDLDVRSAWATRLIERQAREEDLREDVWRSVSLDLLPGWDEDWVVFERERLRQRVLHALEALSRLLVCSGRPAQAVEVAAAAVGADALRESAQRVLIEAYLARGDVDLARHQYDVFRTLLGRLLQVGPTEGLSALVGLRTCLPAEGSSQPSGRHPPAVALPVPRRHAADREPAPTPRSLARPGLARLP